MAASTRTPTTGAISIQDCNITMNQTSTANRSMSKLSTGTADGDKGFVEIFGGPGGSTPHSMSDYYDIRGVIDYQIRYDNIDPGTGIIQTKVWEVTTGNGYNLGSLVDTFPSANWPNGTFVFVTGVSTPSGQPWHYKFIAFEIYIQGMLNPGIDVFIDTNPCGNIPMDGTWTFDNGGAGYPNSYDSPLEIYLFGH
jgi:hypothetical protein